jgi:hypothetical protein
VYGGLATLASCSSLSSLSLLRSLATVSERRAAAAAAPPSPLPPTENECSFLFVYFSLITTTASAPCMGLPDGTVRIVA